jgi:isocitrate lyase
MGKGSTQVQHLAETEFPVSRLEGWLKTWSEEYGVAGPLRVELRPDTAGSDLLSLVLHGPDDSKIARVIFEAIEDRHEKKILSLRYEETFDPSLRRKRLMTLIHLFLIHRYGCETVHYVTPNEENQRQTDRMKDLGLFEQVSVDEGQIIVAAVNPDQVQALLNPDGVELKKLIGKRTDVG